jgi:hypothetical protein
VNEMKKNRFLELVNKEISGEISPAERDVLQEYLRDDPEARKIRSQLLETSELLSQVDDVEPPAHLKGRIMASLDVGRYQARESGPVAELVLRAARLGLRPRFAYAFALGVAVGLIVYSVFLAGPRGGFAPDTRDLYATMGVSRDATLTTVERVPFNLAEAEGSVSLSQLADLLVFEIVLHGARPYEVILEFDPAGASFGGLRPDAPGSSGLELGQGYVRISGAGESQFSLSFIRRPPSPLALDLSLLVSGEYLWDHRFEVEGQDQPQSGEKKE